MTNEKLQSKLFEERIIIETKNNNSATGKMPYCIYCKHLVIKSTIDFICDVDEKTLNEKCLCAKAFNKMQKARAQKSNIKKNI